MSGVLLSGSELARPVRVTSVFSLLDWSIPASEFGGAFTLIENPRFMVCPEVSWKEHVIGILPKLNVDPEAGLHAGVTLTPSLSAEDVYVIIALLAVVVPCWTFVIDRLEEYGGGA